MKLTLPSILVLIVTVTILFFVYQKEERNQLNEAYYTFQSISNKDYFSIEKNISDSLLDVELLGSTFDSNPTLSNIQFKNYSTHLISHTPEIQALEWVPKVYDKERPLYEAIGKKNSPNFRFTRKNQNKIETDIQRPIYYPVLYVEPYVGNENALGFSLDSNPKRSKALNKSEYSHSIIATAGIKLVQEQKTQTGILIFYPVYKKNALTQGKTDLLGFSLVVLRIGDLISRAIYKINPKYVSLCLYDNTDTNKKELLYQSNENINSSILNKTNIKDQNLFKIEKSLNIGERNWLLVFKANKEDILRKNNTKFYIILFIASLLSTLLIFYIERKNRINIALKNSEKELRFALDSGQMGTWKIDLLTNLRVYDDTTYQILDINKDQFKGTEKELLAIIHPDDKSKYLTMIEQSKKHGTKYYIDFRVIWRDKSVHHISSHGMLIKNSKGIPTAIHGILWNDDVRKINEEHIKNMALTDMLTGLPNRRMLNERIKQTFAMNNRLNCYSALMFIDLDKFKDVNDTLGHDAGDDLLIQIKNRFKNTVREVDTIARIGGDEFVILIENTGNTVIDSINSTKIVAEHIKKSFTKPFKLKGKDIFSTCSIGISIFSKQKNNTEEIIKEADFAMYESKSIGRNEIRFYDKQMQETITKRSKLELDLQNSIVNSKFNFTFTPVINTLNNSIYLLETKLFWQRNINELITIDDFYDVAKQNGIIIDIQKWLLEQVIRKISNTPHEEPVIYSVELSSKSLLHPEFRNFLEDLINIYSLNTSKLAISICNEEFHENQDLLLPVIMHISKLGVKIILDNFEQSSITIMTINSVPLFAIKISEKHIKQQDYTNEKSIHSLILFIQLAKMVSTNLIIGGINSEKLMGFFKSHECYLLEGSYFNNKN
ncbi:diguanylate cyclase domain-containing protein [Ferrovum sp. PN-J185]|uniref:diguanylate cyclase domain-containing protein n=1 Tax=Ferrovum sp. PN-J185 TaxID=1356306 RepID=UPI000796F213|nr:diguanylate cyclase [Ferrovum sp. PN-J185]KXW56973.1 cyclic di-GMP phosphodiesterase Gmr [Ferrovum sp. PN-J185]